ncbi:hypothetical protein [Kosakonia radicincitans]|uniref:hypothetical protein n=1 Tax=Kosakonia radicincitans TaxID=283686 RepID=UPI0011AB5E24|nr:hypothetical protein [Kosakonia radicincitans]
MQEAQIHKHVAQSLVGLGANIDDGAYVDIEFFLSGDDARHLVIRLLFMPPSDDPAAAETMYGMIGEDLAKKLSVQVVSFYDRRFDESPPENGDFFAKPKDQFNLLVHELNYLYRTIVEIIFRVADTEQVGLIFFGADNARLKCVYDRYVKRFAEKMGFSYKTQGAYYAIRTQHYPERG